MRLISSEQVAADVKIALAEDIGSGDITADLLLPTQRVRARIVSREALVLCGQAWAMQAFTEVDASVRVEWLVSEGAYVEGPTALAEITGTARGVMTAERTALNFLQTLSGVATLTRAYQLALDGTGVTLLDTRKTLPGLRCAQKYAVRCAGASNHRMGLYDAFLIKENHIAAYGSITEVIAAARAMHPSRFLEIEVQSLDELEQALLAAPERILLDNFSHEMVMQAVLLNRPKRTQLEVSGGVTLENCRAMALTGIDCISVGALTKSVRAMDLSLLVEEVL